tara:strand:- start:182 stop:358 length:177 start_codon:yes stop_codon:yes gene_type:complete
MKEFLVLLKEFLALEDDGDTSLGNLKADALKDAFEKLDKDTQEVIVLSNNFEVMEVIG